MQQATHVKSRAKDGTRCLAELQLHLTKLCDPAQHLAMYNGERPHGGDVRDRIHCVDDEACVHVSPHWWLVAQKSGLLKPGDSAPRFHIPRAFVSTLVTAFTNT